MAFTRSPLQGLPKTVGSDHGQGRGGQAHAPGEQLVDAGFRDLGEAAVLGAHAAAVSRCYLDFKHLTQEIVRRTDESDWDEVSEYLSGRGSGND